MNDKAESSQPGADKVIAFPERKSVRAQAARWIAVLEVDKPSAEDLVAFRCWVNESKVHYEEFERLNNLWGDLNLLTQLTQPSEHTRTKKHASRSSSINIPGRWLNGRHMLASIAVVAVLVVGGLMAKQALVPTTIYQTAIGEQQTIVLPDNSTVSLNTNSYLKVDYSDERRGIYLLQGEAHFDVTKDPQRPFEVAAGAGLVRAIGTAFNVRLRQTAVEVTVDEGVVEIDPQLPQLTHSDSKTPPADNRLAEAQRPAVPDPTRLRAGSQAVFERDRPQAVTLEHSVALERTLAWREGLLEFRRDPLSKVVAEVSRYTDTKIIITDEQTGQQRVGGRFKIGDIPVLLEALESGFDIKVERVNNNTIYLSYAGAVSQ